MAGNNITCMTQRLALAHVEATADVDLPFRGTDAERRLGIV